MKSLIAIVGPTATGKTELSLNLAQELDGEIVNADSRQVYRHMETGTAKPTPEQRSGIPHHLFDILDPEEDFSLGIYQNMAYRVIKDIHDRGRLPILVGGSGQYVWAILEGWRVPEIPPDGKIRGELESRAESEGPEALYRELQEKDPEAARGIDARNIRRVVRALEVHRITGKPFSELRSKNPPEFDIRIFGLTMERAELYRRIDERVDRMIESGFIEEVRGLLDRGYSPDLPAMSGLGYRELCEFINGETKLEEAIQRIKYATHRFVRRQYNWFRLEDERIKWYDVTSGAVSVGVIVQELCNAKH